MVGIVLPTTTSPGIRPGEGAGRLINCYATALGAGARSAAARHRVPGLRKIAATTHNTGRGVHYYNGDLYVAQKDRLTLITYSAPNFVVTDLGSLPGSLPVSFARNNKAPVPDILCVTENDVYKVFRAAPPTSLGEASLPQPLAVRSIDGYFVFPIRDGRFFFSAINNTTVGALDFGKAESRPGGILNAIPYGEQLLFFGPSVAEVWSNAGNPTGSPFSRASVIQKGLASTNAVAGFEEGFSTIVFVGDDNAVYRLDGGYTPTRISTPDLETLIELLEDKTLLDVSVAVTSGHMWATITAPHFSWTYEVSSGLWHERASYGAANWRAVTSAQAFGLGWVMLDRNDDTVWLLDPNSYKEGTDPLVMEVWSAPMQDFPNRVIIPRADFDITVGQSLVAGVEPIETDPVVMISWSDDGGEKFGAPLVRKIGPIGKYKAPVTVNRTGTTGRYGRVWKLQISDPVYTSINAGTMETSGVSR